MSGLKTFIMTEEVKVSHAERYLNFVERYHHQVFIDLRTRLAQDWSKEISQLSKKMKPSEESIEDALLRNDNVLTELTLSAKSEKIVSSRSNRAIEAACSVKIPMVYNSHDRNFITDALTKTAVESFKTVASNWSDVFNFEHKGRLTPWFKIVKDGNEVRLQLSMNSGSIESFKTLYSVYCEFGKQHSKTKSFDRVYLVSHI